ncbi:MAG TPA: prephenate dehydrogenase/arogenate dehydrogenase family protein [Anaerolineales bacterium]|nr:prephenate dehydrogenase/arogenate dehydrogenase family protein [Anaerolineales bacterium]
MEDGFRLPDSKIAIIGLGLMGGSLAMALKGKCAALYGIDSDPATLELVLDQGAVDQSDSDPAKLLTQADLVILAAPVPDIISYIHRLPSLIQHPCIIFDLGSTKNDIVLAMSGMPAYFDPIGGHPICGKEKLGFENAEAALFHTAPFVITPLERTSSRARSAAEQIISAVGARMIEMDAQEHDRILASTSHLPFLLASALALSTRADYSPLIGSGFRSTSRLAGTPSSIMLGILKSNRENILNAIHSFQLSLSEISAALQAENYIQLEGLLHQSRSAFQALTEN